MTSAQAYPLQWPQGTPRTKHPVRSRFTKKGWEAVLKELDRELSLLGARSIVISTNRRLRPDGKPYATQTKADDAEPAVAVYFQLKGSSTCLPCDRYVTMSENLWAVVLTIAAMRALDRYGVGKGGQVFDGFKALPANAGDGLEDPWAILGLSSSATADQVKTAYLKLAQEAHPDMPGGSAERMAMLNTARDQIFRQMEGER